MAYSLVQKVSVDGGGATSTINVTSTTAGNLLVLVVEDGRYSAGNSTYTLPAGWQTYKVNNNDGYAYLTSGFFYYPNNPGGITSVTVTRNSAASGGALTLLEFSGVSTGATPVDVSTNAVASAFATSGSWSVTTTGANDLVIAALVLDDSPAGAPTTTEASGWTTAVDYSDGGGVGFCTTHVAYETAGAAGTVTYNPSWSKNTDWTVYLVAFKPGASGPVVNTHGVQAQASLLATRTHGAQAKTPLTYTRSHGAQASAALTYQQPTASSFTLRRTGGGSWLRSGDTLRAASAITTGTHGAQASAALSVTRAHAATARAALQLTRSHGAQASVVVSASATQNTHGVQAGAVIHQTKLAPMPVISRGLPSYGNSGSYPASYANDSNYANYWNSVNVPSTGTPAWWAVDLSTVSATQRKQVMLAWYGDSGDGYWVADGSGGSLTNNPRDYTIQVNSAAGGGAMPTTGWVTLKTVTANVYTSRTHALDLTGYNWVQLSFTASNGTAPNNTISIQVDIHDAHLGTTDQMLVLGDSITWEGAQHRDIDGNAWTEGPIAELIADMRPGYQPLMIDGGWPGMTMAWAASNITSLLAVYEQGNYVNIGFATNDVNQSYVMNTTQVQAVYTNLLTVLDAIVSAGYMPVVPYCPWGGNNGGDYGVNAKAFNDYVDAHLPTDRPNKYLRGPNFWTTFNTYQNLIRDGIHPTYDHTVAAGEVAGLVGYEHWQRLWSHWYMTTVYQTETTHGAQAAVSLATTSTATHAVISAATLSAPHTHATQASAALTLSRAHAAQTATALAFPRTHASAASAVLALTRTHQANAQASVQLSRTHAVHASVALAGATGHGAQAHASLQVTRAHGTLAAVTLAKTASHGTQAHASLAAVKAHGTNAAGALALSRTHGASGATTLLLIRTHGAHAAVTLAGATGHGAQAVATLSVNATHAHAASATATLVTVRTHSAQAQATVAFIRTHAATATASLQHAGAHGAHAAATLQVVTSHSAQAAASLTLTRTHSIAAQGALALTRTRGAQGAASLGLTRTHSAQAHASLQVNIAHGAHAAVTLSSKAVAHGVTAVASLLVTHTHGAQAQASLAHVITHGAQAQASLSLTHSHSAQAHASLQVTRTHGAAAHAHLMVPHSVRSQATLALITAPLGTAITLSGPVIGVESGARAPATAVLGGPSIGANGVRIPVARVTLIGD